MDRRYQPLQTDKCSLTVQLLREDYLEHRTLYEAVQSIMVDKARQHPLRILDLGCGDSDYIARLLAAAGGASIVESYTGVDLSEPALAISERNIERCSPIRRETCQVVLHGGL